MAAHMTTIWLQMMSQCEPEKIIKLQIMLINYSQQDISKLAAEYYSFAPTAVTSLGGYSDRNYLLEDAVSNSKYILKITHYDEDIKVLQLQNMLFAELDNLQLEGFRVLKGIQFPRVRRSKNGLVMVEMWDQLKQHCNCVRMFQYIQGGQLYDVPEPAQQLIESVGTLVGEFSREMELISQTPEISKLVKTIDWSNEPFDLCNLNQFYKNYFLDIPDPSIQQIVSAVLLEYNNLVLPHLHTLKTGIIHNDICGNNIIVQTSPLEGYTIKGLIDFGNTTYSCVLFELIVACARVNFHREDPLRNMILIAKEYHKVKKLQKLEIQLLFPLVKARLALLTLLSSHLHALHGAKDNYFSKCRSGHYNYLTRAATACDNQSFLIRFKKAIGDE